MKRSLIGAALIAGALSASQAQAACGKVTISDMNWASATLMANVDKLILKHGYGCDAELMPGDTMPTGTSMGDFISEFSKIIYEENITKIIPATTLMIFFICQYIIPLKCFKDFIILLYMPELPNML